MSYTGAVLRVLPTLPLGRGTDPFGLTEGQLLRAVVLRSGAGTADLLLQGQVLQLRTELSLVPGTPLVLQVREVGADGVTLGLAPEAATGQGQAATAAPATRPLTPDDLRDLAAALRLPAGERTQTILRELMANGRPLTHEAVQQVLAAARATGAEGAVALRPLVWLVAHGLPVTPATLALAEAALPADAPLPAPALPGALPAVQLARQARAVDALLARAGADLPPAAHAPALGVRAAQARLGLAGPPPEPATAEGLALRLAALAEGVATPVEAKLARLLAGAAARPAVAAPAGAAPAASGPDQPAEAAAAPALPAGAAPLAPADGARPGAADLRLLVARALGAIEEHAPTAHRGAGMAGTGRTAAVTEALTALATGLEFSQLANAARADAAGGRQTVWLPLPLPPGPHGQPPSLAISRWAGGDPDGQPRRLRATLCLSLQHLGDLIVHLDLVGRRLRCDIRATAPGLAVIQPQVEALTERLVALGFAGAEAVVTAESAPPLPPLTAPPPRRLDQRA
jgi:hypothetical protein